jgi:Na+/H+ antiporter
MESFEHALALLLLVTTLGIAARWIPWPRPITYVVGGLICALIPGFPPVAFDPEFFFVCFLPPLLFSDAWQMPLRDFAKAKTQVLLLATGLVAFTTIGVGYFAHWLVPALPLAMAFALGAVVSPTDAVAVNAITERLKIPTRLRIVLSGESLLNDASGLVAFKFALAALVAGSFSLRAMSLQFALLALGGFLLGLVLGFLVGKLRDLLRRTGNADPISETMLSLMTPFAAYLAGEALHVSGILSVIAAGLYSGWRDPVRMDAETRQTTWTVWSAVIFWLNGLVFVLLGLQFPRIAAAVAGLYSVPQLLGFTIAIASVTVLLRLAWFFPGAYLPFLCSRAIRHREPQPSWQAVFLGGWSGLRGAVTLAAALSIPLTLANGDPFPGRDLVIFLASGVVLATLVLQGTTIERLIRYLKLHEDGIQVTEEQIARKAAVDAGLKTLRSLESSLLPAEEIAALRHVASEYEQRLSELSAEGETKSNARQRRAAQRRFRFAALEAERDAIDGLWRGNVIADDVHRPLQQMLDHEEAMLKAQPLHAELTVSKS